MRLGRAPHDPAIVGGLRPLDVPLSYRPTIPIGSRLPSYVPKMWENDVYPCCTFASLAEYQRILCNLWLGFDLNIADVAPLDAYAAASNIPLGNPAALASSPGLRMTDVARWQMTNGFQTGFQLTSGAPGTIGLSISSMFLALRAIGVVWAGVDLYQADEAAISAGQVLDTTQAPGSLVGGHALVYFDADGTADTDIVTISTWGMRAHATWRWVMARTSEAHGVIYKNFLREFDNIYQDTYAQAVSILKP